MDIIVTSIDAKLAGETAAALERSSIPRLRVVASSIEAALARAAAHESPTTLPILFCCRSFAPEDLDALRKLCFSKPERVKVIASGAVEDVARILDVVRCGAIDYLKFGADFCGSLAEVLNRVRALQRNAERPGSVVAVVGPVGGAGKSLVAGNLAAAFAQVDGRAGLIDMHFRRGDLASLLNVMPRHGIVSLLGKASQLDGVMFEQSLVDHECGIRLLAGADAYGEARVASPESVARIFRFARERFAHTVADFEEGDPTEQAKLFDPCDRIVVVLRPDFVALSRAKRYLEALARARISDERMVFVVNRTGQEREMPIACMADALGVKTFHSIPNEPAVVHTSYNLGSPLVASHPDSQVAQSIRRLAAVIRGAPPESNRPAPLPDWRTLWRKVTSSSVTTLLSRATSRA